MNNYALNARNLRLFTNNDLWDLYCIELIEHLVVQYRAKRSVVRRTKNLTRYSEPISIYPGEVTFPTQRCLYYIVR